MLLGSVLCIPYPWVWRGLWNLGTDPRYVKLMADNDRPVIERPEQRCHHSRL